MRKVRRINPAYACFPFGIRDKPPQPPTVLLQDTQADTLFTQPANAVKATKGSFDTVATVIRFLGTTGLRFILQFWFAKTPIYHLPKGWAPWAVEWVLAFPRAPKGTVSIQVWGSACAVVIALVSDAVSYVVVARQQKKASSAQKGQAQGVKVAAGGESEKTAAGEGKKEL